jgi:hypothetical protein
MFWKKFLGIILAFAIAFLLGGLKNISAEPATAEIKLIHASPDAPNIDIYIDGKKVASSVGYAKIVTQRLTAGEKQVEIYPAGKKEQPLLTKIITLQGGNEYTAVVAGRVREGVDLVFTQNTTEIPQGKAKIRVLYASPDAPSIAVAEKNGPLLFERVLFKEVSDYREIAPKTYNFEVRLAGTESSILDIPDVKVEPNTAYTIVALDVKGEPKLQALILTTKKGRINTQGGLGEEVKTN